MSWLVLVGSALAGPRLITVTETIALDAPVELAWTKLATSEGVTTIDGAEVLPHDPKLVIDDRSERIPAIVDGRPGDWVVVSIDGPRLIKLRWEPQGAGEERFLDVALSGRGQGTAVEATLVYPASTEDQRRRDVSRALQRGLEAFRAAVDGDETRR